MAALPARPAAGAAPHRSGAPLAPHRRSCRRGHRFGPLLRAWVAATTLSGIPSTVHALLTGADVSEATRAAGSMLISPTAPFPQLFGAAALVHGTVSLFWASVLMPVLPREHTMRWAVAASLAIGLLDLRLIAPRFFPAVAALPFWPQMADHLMWGAVYGAARVLERGAGEAGCA